MEFKCQQCGNCCKCLNWEIDILPAEILRIWSYIKDNLKYKNIIFPFFVPNQFQEGEDILYFLAEQPILGNIVRSRFVLSKDLSRRCVFLDKKNRCSIYNIRPFSCLAFPIGNPDQSICPEMKNKPSLKEATIKLKKYAQNPDNNFLQTTKLYQRWNEEVASKSSKFLKPTVAGFMEYSGLLKIYTDPQFIKRVLRGKG